MLPVIPSEILGKVKYKNRKPVATCELTEEEQKIFDEFCEYFDKLCKMRFEVSDD